MDPLIKKRRVMILHHPFDKSIDGSATFKADNNVLGIIVPKQKYKVEGREEVVSSHIAIYLDGSALPDLNKKDEFTVPFYGRLPIQDVNIFPSLLGGYELIEVIL